MQEEAICVAFVFILICFYQSSGWLLAHFCLLGQAIFDIISRIEDISVLFVRYRAKFPGSRPAPVGWWPAVCRAGARQREGNAQTGPCCAGCEGGASAAAFLCCLECRRGCLLRARRVLAPARPCTAAGGRSQIEVQRYFRCSPCGYTGALW